MFGLLLALLIIDGIVLAVVVLLQAGKGGGLAAMGGGAGAEAFIGGRQAATLLTKATWTTGGIFLFLAFVLSILSSSRAQQPESILRQEFRQTAPAPVQPVVPGTQPTQPGEAQPQGAQPGQVPPSEGAAQTEPQATPPAGQ